MLYATMPLFWWYFTVMGVKAHPDASFSWHTIPKYPVAAFIRSGIVLGLGIAATEGVDLGNNLLLLAFGLSVLVGPLTIPTIGNPASTLEPLRFLGYWMLTTFDAFIKTSLFVALLAAISWVIDWLTSGTVSGLVATALNAVTVVDPIRDHFIVPGDFLVASTVVVVLKSFAVCRAINTPYFKQYSPISFLLTLGVGLFVLAYTYNISLLVPDTPAGWGSPITGILGAWLSSLAFAYVQAIWDEQGQHVGNE